jgi:hypothetical protein
MFLQGDCNIWNDITIQKKSLRTVLKNNRASSGGDQLATAKVTLNRVKMVCQFASNE